MRSERENKETVSLTAIDVAGAETNAARKKAKLHNFISV